MKWDTEKHYKETLEKKPDLLDAWDKFVLNFNDWLLKLYQKKHNLNFNERI